MSEHTTPVPKSQNVIAYLCIRDAAKAIEFYERAFGASEVLARISDSSGRVSRAELLIGGSKLYIADEHPEFGFRSPQSLGGSHVQFVVNVPDVDAMVARAAAAGGTLTRPVANQFYGHRTGEITDPFGYRWTLSTVVEELSEDELLRRAAAEEKRRNAARAGT